jgi:CO/xanthine dehydrogenase FAD-binding subunit
MYPASFQYFAPTTLDEALALLEEYGDEGKVLAGGQRLIPLKLRCGSRCRSRFEGDAARYQAAA